MRSREEWLKSVREAQGEIRPKFKPKGGEYILPMRFIDANPEVHKLMGPSFMEEVEKNNERQD